MDSRIWCILDMVILSFRCFFAFAHVTFVIEDSFLPHVWEIDFCTSEMIFSERENLGSILFSVWALIAHSSSPAAF